MGLREINQTISQIRSETGNAPSLIRISETTMRTLAEHMTCTTLIAPPAAKPDEWQPMLCGIPVRLVPEMPLGEIRLVTSRGIEARIINCSVS